jgi:hypothetical protein
MAQGRPSSVAGLGTDLGVESSLKPQRHRRSGPAVDLGATLPRVTADGPDRS